jgi:hypothetical protein
MYESKPWTDLTLCYGLEEFQTVSRRADSKRVALLMEEGILRQSLRRGGRHIPCYDARPAEIVCAAYSQIGRIDSICIASGVFGKFHGRDREGFARSASAVVKLLKLLVRLGHYCHINQKKSNLYNVVALPR